MNDFLMVVFLLVAVAMITTTLMSVYTSNEVRAFLAGLKNEFYKIKKQWQEKD